MSDPAGVVPTLIVTGSCGVGKTTVVAEITDVLAERRIPSAALDLDALTWQWPPSSPFNADLMVENLAALWPRYLAHGAERLVLAGVVEDRAELDRYRTAVPGAEIVVCRLTAPLPQRIARLRERMQPGESRDWHERRTAELDEVLDRAAVADLEVDNGDRPPRAVAVEVLERVGWR